MTESLPRVLVVDDDQDLAQHLARLVAQHGFAADVASSGAEALARIEQGGVDVILSDIRMPGFNGLDVLAAVRRLDLDVPVLLMTGEPTLDSAMMAVEDRAFRYLPKPLSRTHLVPALERAVEQGKLDRARRAALAATTGKS